MNNQTQAQLLEMIRTLTYIVQNLESRLTTVTELEDHVTELKSENESLRKTQNCGSSLAISMPEITQLISEQKPINAIKLVREKTNWSLLDAKNFTEAFRTALSE